MGRRLPDGAHHRDHGADDRVPSSVSPSSVSPTNVQPTIPSTGTAGVVPWTWALPPLALAAFLIFLSRFRRPSPS